MAKLVIEIDEKSLHILDKISKARKKSKEEIVKEIILNEINKKFREDLIIKAKSIIQEEKELLMKLA